MFSSVILGIIFIVFLYFGYKEDYKRDPKEFFKIIIGLPIVIISSFMGFFGIGHSITKLLDKEKKTKGDE